MSTGSHNFDELQKMLALKRREQPPQQFFKRLPDAVLHNLDAPERPETMSWLQRLGVHFDVSPAVVGAVGILVCSLLTGGITFALSTERPRPKMPLEPLDAGTVALGQPPLGALPPRPPTEMQKRPTEEPSSKKPINVPDYPDVNLVPPPTVPPTAPGDIKK